MARADDHSVTVVAAPRSNATLIKHPHQGGDVGVAVGNQIPQAGRQRLGLDHHRQRGGGRDTRHHHEVGSKCRHQTDESDVDRASPVDLAHDRDATGRCWVPIRLRNTQ